MTLVANTEKKLLEYLESKSNRSLRFRDGLQLFASGTEATLYSFSLKYNPQPYKGRLLLRITAPDAQPGSTLIYSIFSSYLSDLGLPTPNIFTTELNEAWFGTSFLIMQNLSRPRSLRTRIRRRINLLLRNDQVIDSRCEIARTQFLGYLHSIDSSGLLERIDASNVSRAKHLLCWDRAAEAELLVDKLQIEWLYSSIQWLQENRPKDDGRAVCHGDLNESNLQCSDGILTGVFDWTGGHIGHPESDLALICAYCRLSCSSKAAETDNVNKILTIYRQYGSYDEIRLVYYEAAFWINILALIVNRSLARSLDGYCHSNPSLDAHETIPKAIMLIRQLTGVSVIVPQDVLWWLWSNRV